MFFTLLDVLRLFFLTMEIILLGNNHGNNSFFIAFCGLSGFVVVELVGACKLCKNEADC